MERLKSSLGKFYGRYGHLIKHYAVSLSQMLHDILGHDHIQWHPQLNRYYTSLRPYYRTWLHYWFWPYYQNFGGFHRTLQRVRLANRGRFTPPDTWSCPIWDLHLFWCWDHSFLNLSCLRIFWVSNIPRYFYFASFPNERYVLTTTLNMISYERWEQCCKKHFSIFRYMLCNIAWFQPKFWSKYTYHAFKQACL